MIGENKTSRCILIRLLCVYNSIELCLLWDTNLFVTVTRTYCKSSGGFHYWWFSLEDTEEKQTSELFTHCCRLYKRIIHFTFRQRREKKKEQKAGLGCSSLWDRWLDTKAQYCVHTGQINTAPDPEYYGSNQKVNIIYLTSSPPVRPSPVGEPPSVSVTERWRCPRTWQALNFTLADWTAVRWSVTIGEFRCECS